jgi:ABC-type antimicrobial peptide transport system permease subunit
MPCTTVVGVAENAKARSITADDEYMYYLPMDQYIASFGEPMMVAFFARAAGRPEDMVEPLRARLQRLMPGPSFVRTVPLHELVDPSMRAWTSGAQTFLTFGVVALVLAAVGLYAVIAFSVAQRTRELGVRLALGAQGGDLLRLVVGEGVRVTVVGVVLGTLVALAVSGRIRELLFEVSPHDPAVYAAVGTTLVIVGVLASVIPASRAARVDPNIALRAE